MTHRIEVNATTGETKMVEYTADEQAALPTPTVASYAELRAVAYPSIQDQLDTIFHDGLDAWKAEIQAVKDLHPKP
jgi:hypothetical protein